MPSKQMASRSRLGDFDHVSRSNYAPSPAQSPFARYTNLNLPLLTSSLSHTDDNASVSEPNRSDVEDGTELDSRDSHLPSFRLEHEQAQIYTQKSSSHKTTTAGPTINLPIHDGLGSFELENVMSAAVQEHLSIFKKFNLQVERRRESFNRAKLECQVSAELTEDIERTRRIEAWIWEQSMVLLEEIKKRTRCQRESDSRRSGPVPGTAVTAVMATASEDAATGGAGGEQHEQEDERLPWQFRQATCCEEEENEGIWSRIMWKFILDMMGIDDRILSILFGETFVGDEEWREEIDFLSTPGASNTILAAMDISLEDADDGSSSSS